MSTPDAARSRGRRRPRRPQDGEGRTRTRPRNDQPRQDRPRNGQPRKAQSTNGQSTNGQSTHGQGGNGQARQDRPREDRPVADAPANGFTALGVDPAITAILAEQGITVPRPIQAETIAAGMAGHDVCGRAPTGSGKTLAFSLPLAHMNRSRGKPVALVLAPTRELALQIAEVLEPLAAPKGLRVQTLIGGTKIDRDIKQLRQGCDIVVGCPGRMVDLVNRSALVLRHVRTAVLDEADRMADMGFMPDVTRLLDETGCEEGQLLLFSATLDETTDKLERRYQDSPVRVDVESAPQAKGDVTHTWRVVPRTDRRDATVVALRDHSSAIVFTRTKRGADRLARQLSKDGHSAAPIHGDRSQSQRQRALAQFTDGKVQVLVATDIAARGIHVDEVDLVLHYDLPGSPEDYTHRSGRTGRAGADGTVVALVCDDNGKEALDLEKALQVPVTWDGPRARPTEREKPTRGGGGGAGGGGNRGQQARQPKARGPKGGGKRNGSTRGASGRGGAGNRSGGNRGGGSRGAR